jgi:hypothetical protein
MLINRQAINAYLDRDFDSFLWMKRLTREAIMRELNSLKVKPTFKTEPWLHQLVCFYIGICNPRFLYLLDMGLGKALANDEQVLTPNGYVPMGALKVGDKVMGGNGEPADVIGVYPQGIKPLYAVTLSDGVTVRCCDDHLWDVRTPLQSRYETKPLREFRGTLRYAPSGKSEQGNLRWFIPVSPAINFENQEAPTYLHPYIVGALLGDGCLVGTNCSITFHEDDGAILSKIEKLLPDGITSVFTARSGSSETWSFRGNGGQLRQFIKRQGMNVGAHSKRIPERYLMGSITERYELLSGLLDTDGSACKQRAFDFGVVSKNLAAQVQFLTHSLGGTAKLRVNHNDFGPVYRVYGRTPLNPFYLERKRRIYDQGKAQPTRSIVSVEPVGDGACTCISVSNSDGLFLTRGAVVTHNSKILADLITQARRERKLEGAIIFVPRITNIDSWVEALLEHSDLEPWPIGSSDTEEKYERLLKPRGDVTLIDYQGFQLAMSKKEPGKKKANKLVPDDKKFKLIQRQYNFVGLDESHKLKGHDNLWFRLIDRITKTAEFCYATTGTLFGREVEDLWSQFRIVDQGETFGENLGLFRAGLFTSKMNAWKGTVYTFNPRMDRQLTKMLQHRSIRYDEDEVLDLPSKVGRMVSMEMGEEQREHYVRALEGMINSGDGTREMEACWLRMRQIISGYLAWTDQHGKHVLPFKHNPKLDALERLIDEMGDSKIVICYDYTETGRMIVERVKAMGLGYEWFYGGTQDQSASRKRFLTQPSCRVFVMNSEAGGTGNDGLQKVARYMVFYETPPSPTSRKQTEKRIHRPGQTGRTFIYDLVMRKSLDRPILDNIKKGSDLYLEVVNGKSKKRATYLTD